MYDAQKRTTFNNTGVNGAEVPPVPIPNTEVKLSCAESTWLDTAWEDMSMPVSKKKEHTELCVLSFFVFSIELLSGNVSSHQERIARKDSIPLFHNSRFDDVTASAR